MWIEDKIIIDNIEYKSAGNESGCRWLEPGESGYFLTDDTVAHICNSWLFRVSHITKLTAINRDAYE